MKKLIGLLILISFFSMVFLIYKDFKANELNKGYYLAQSYFFLIFFILSTIVFFNNKNNQIYFVLILTSIICSFYFFEFYLFKSGGIKFFTSANDHWQNDEIFHKKEIKKKNAFSPFSLISENLVSFSGISNVEVVHCKESDFFSVYSSDRYGFNNPDNVWDKPIDLVILGDSFVHGNCVNKGDDITSQVRKIGNLNAINLGWPDTGTLKQYARFVEYVENYPSYIFWVYYENDLDDLNDELNHKLLKNYLIDDNFRQYLRSKKKRIEIDKLLLEKHFNYMKENHRIDTRVKSYSNFINYLKLYKTRQVLLTFFKNITLNKNIPNSVYYNNLLNEYFFIFDKLKKKADENNSKIVFVYLPAFKYSFSNKSKYFKNIKNELIKKMNKENVGIIDIEKKLNEKFILPLHLYAKHSFGHHFNEDGYKFVAENIIEYLSNKD